MTDCNMARRSVNKSRQTERQISSISRTAAAFRVLARGNTTLLPEDAGQRPHNLCETFNALRQQTRRWLAARCFEAVAHDRR